MTDSNDPAAGGASESERNLANEVSATFAKLGGGERLAVLGAAIVLVGWLLFDLLIDEYSTGYLQFALAVVIVGGAWTHHKGAGADPMPYKSLLFVTAGILGLLGAYDLIEELRADIFDADATTIIGALVYWAGAIMAGVGALQLRSK